MAIKRNLFRDILRDTNSRKYSMTKLAAFTSLILLVIAVGAAIGIMISTGTIDHILIGELIALLLTLLGFKNFRKNFPNLNAVTPQALPPTEAGEKDTDHLEEDGDKDEIG
jgi:hypothetical protein